MSLSDGVIFLGVILIVIGIPETLINLYEWFKDKKLLKTGNRTTGIIVESVTYPQDDTVNTGQYRFIASFTDNNGISAFSKSRFASRSPATYMNKDVIIVYDKNNPDISRFEVDISLVRDVIEKFSVLLLGIVLILSGFYW
ncbi:MAG: hypothetical protein ACOCX9_07750 [Spirochaetota bacterium]